MDLMVRKVAWLRKGEHGKILSRLSSVGDPLGFGTASLLKGRKIIQEVCQKKLKKDEDIPQSI